MTSKWLLGVLVTIIVMGAGAWMTYVQGQIGSVQTEQRKAAEVVADQKAAIEVGQERIKALVEGQKRQEESLRDMMRKLDELLRRIR